MQGKIGYAARMKYLNKKYLADGVIFSGMLMNAVFICLILYFLAL